ncbi:MAG: hypothetical protein CMH41_06105 [Micrococcales bacterium]|nr:hypothetical protein [Micrococcales bacterium]
MSNWGHGEYPPNSPSIPTAPDALGEPNLPPPPDGFTLTHPSDQITTASIGTASGLPQSEQITSVGIAIMPGMPLPEWVNQQSLAEVLVPALENAPNYPLTHPVPGFHPGLVGTLGGQDPMLSLPDPQQRSEQPTGPVSWGAPPVPDSSPFATPAPHPAMPVTAAVPVATHSPQMQEPPTPTAPEQQFDWLLQPDVTGPDRIPGYAPPPIVSPSPGLDATVPIPPAPQGFFLPAGPTMDEQSNVPVPAPPEGYYVAQTIAADVPLSTTVPPPPEGFYIPDPSAFSEPVVPV